jgi:hypothetical protein
MKNSLKLLTGTLLVIVVAMFGAAVSLRKQYDSFDKTDRYARWKKQALGTFRAVQIEGASWAMVQLEPGKAARLLTDTLDQADGLSYTHKVARDTLFLRIDPVDGWQFRPDDEDDAIRGPQLVVQSPTLTAVSTRNANCQILDHTGTSLAIEQRGLGGRTLLEHVKYEQLTASLSGRNQLTLAHFNNKISNASITLTDSARLHQYCDVSGTFSLRAAPGTSVRLTGRAVQQVNKE